MADLADIGVVGLGVMGANLALNLGEKGFRVALFDRDPAKRAALASDPSRMEMIDCASESALMQALKPPRAVIILVPAGDATDAAIAGLSSVAAKDDLLIDAGNADFHDTRRRSVDLEAQGLRFLGMGVSGGAEGARHGPALMAGGSRDVWDRVSPMLTAIAAKHGASPCAAWLGPDGAGHFVKTVHNGIEYADMQMIAEVYGVMRDGLSLSAEEIAQVFAGWSAGPLASYLVEITAEVASARDPLTQEPLLSIIADRAGQKGTGRWSIIEAQRLGVVASTIEAAVGARNLSGDQAMRSALAAPRPVDLDLETATLHDALHAGKIIAYAQGFDLMAEASDHYAWGLDYAQIARTWRAGCIIRSAFLDDIALAFDAAPGTRLMAAEGIQARLAPLLPALRRTVSLAIGAGLPMPSLTAALAHFDQLARPRGTADMIQGLRDRFGRHGFQRTDRDGAGYHGPWAEN